MNPDDELIKAALIDDEEDLREKEAKSTPEEPSTKETDAPEQPVENDSEEAEEDEELSEDEGEQPEPEEKMTRKERREAKKQAWLENVRREQAQQEQAPQQFQNQPQQPQYQPIDYRTVEELNEQELERDRATYAEMQRRNGMIQGREAERYVAEQQNFWQGVEYESKILAYDPEFKFLDDRNPDTFDPDLAADLNEKYLAFVGFNEQNNTVKRTDISYEKFVRNEVAERKAWAERLAAESNADLAETKANTGLRPGGASRKSGLGTLKPGDISKMSDEELAKYEDEIDRQILSAFN